MNTIDTISNLTNTPTKRDTLLGKSDSEKLKLVMQLTSCKDIIELLDYIEGAEDDRSWCELYR
jgi:hypothetical protein